MHANANAGALLGNAHVHETVDPSSMGAKAEANDGGDASMEPT